MLDQGTEASTPSLMDKDISRCLTQIYEPTPIVLAEVENFNLISDMHPILVLFSHHAEKNGLRNGEVTSFKLAGPKSECSEWNTFEKDSFPRGFGK